MQAQPPPPPPSNKPVFPPLEARKPSSQRIPQKGLVGREKKPYVPDDGLVAAANAAIMLGMPLLLTGEPGCGKTDFASAVSNYLDGRRPPAERQGLRECYVRSDTRARDLLYQYDALRRFGDAQHGDDEAKRTARDPRRYIELQPLGLALCAPVQQVVLIDEIDKAPRDLPNDLLRELERGVFEIPEIPANAAGDVSTDFKPWGDHQQPLRRIMTPPAGADRRPVIIITSNVERQLPDAFLRRCVFFHIRFPTQERLADILLQRRQSERSAATPPPPAAVGAVDQDVPYLDRIIKLFLAIRELPGLHKKPSTAELFNWIDVLDESWEYPSLFARLGALVDDHDPATRNFRVHSWRDLPALPCLIKQREDLDALG